MGKKIISQKNGRISVLIAFLLLQLFAAGESPALDAPHTKYNGLSCAICHITNPPADWWTDQGASNSGLCSQCHNVDNPQMDAVIHSGPKYGESVQCTACHSPHDQKQYKVYKSQSYLYSGAASNVTTTTIRKAGAGWTPGAYNGMVLLPNTLYSTLNHQINNNTADTITIESSGGDRINTTYTKAGSIFAVVYGKLIKESIDKKTVRFFRGAGNNSFADGDAVIDGVCQVCHKNTTSFNNSGTLEGPDHPPSQAGTNCKSCHKHDQGFKATCSSCHGSPPIAGNQGGPNGLANNDGGTGSTTPGSHKKHAVTLEYTCDTCHTGGMPTSPVYDKNIQIGFNIAGGAYQSGTYDGRALPLANGYGYAPGNAGTTITNTGAISCSNIYCHGATMDPNGGTDITPVWDDPATAACGACHGATAANSPTRGAHVKHAGPDTGAGYAYPCTLCHNTTTAQHVDNKSEVVFSSDPRVAGATYSGTDIMLDAYGACTSAYCHSNAAPAPNDEPAKSEPNEYKTVSWDGASQKCYSCHKGKLSDNTEADCSSIGGTWDSYCSGPPVTQGVCESNGGAWSTSEKVCRGIAENTCTVLGGRWVTVCTPSLTMSSNGHERLAGPQWIRKYPCTYCHSGTVDANGAVVDKSKHVNQSKDVVMSTDWAIPNRSAPTYKWDSVKGKMVCDNVYCHSDGTTNPEQVRPFAWTDGKTQCNTCHGHPQGTCSSSGCHDGRTDGNGKYWQVKTGWPAGEEWKAAMPMFPNQGPDSQRPNSHPRHLQTEFQCDTCHYATIKNGTCTDCHSTVCGYFNKTVTNPCSECHNPVPSTSMSEVAHIDATYHVNRFKDVTFQYGNWSYDKDTKTCSGTSCHSGGKNPRWGDSVNDAMTCLNCHQTTVQDVDDFQEFNGKQAKINLTEWVTTGHGRPASAGVYLYSNNPPADFPGNPCWYCHDNNVLHKDSANPFRLRQHQQFANRFEKECVYCHMERKSDSSECIACHVNQTESLAPQATAGGIVFKKSGGSTETKFTDHTAVGGCIASNCHNSDMGTFGRCRGITQENCATNGGTWNGSYCEGITETTCNYYGGTDTHKGHSETEDNKTWSAPQKADIRNKYLMMGVCLKCHDDDSTGECRMCHADYDSPASKYKLGFNPNPQDPSLRFIKPQKARASSAHFGYKHNPSGVVPGTKGGKFCWDCHDPHGDGNIYMVQAQVATSTDGVYGKPATRAPVKFDKKMTGADYARSGNAPPGQKHDGICNVCHTQGSQHYKDTYGDGHNQGRICTKCHEHRFTNSHASGGSCTTCHSGKPVPRHTAFGLPRDCTKCHDGVVGKRMDVMGQLRSNSHHIQRANGEIRNTDCYVCHWEATETGLINITYHEGYDYKAHVTTKDAKVDLVIWGAGTRPTSTSYKTSQPGATATTFLATDIGAANERAQVDNITLHCLGCHSDQNNDTQPFGDCKTPRQYAWDRISIASRYGNTGTTTWGKYAAYPNAAKKNITKAFSAHGNAQNNFGGGWDAAANGTGNDGNLNPTRGGANTKSVQCFDCHSSHGSKASGTTSSYVTFNGTLNGGNLKETQAGKGGYSMTYKAAAKTTGVNPYNAGAGQCFDCHETENAGTTPWGYKSTFGATAPIMGYKDTSRFGAGTKGSNSRYSFFKTITDSASNMGGHLHASSPLSKVVNPGGKDPDPINGLCTPCHDPHGVSPSLDSDMAYAVPLLKGTWLTSPYKEDAPPPDPTLCSGSTYTLAWGFGYNQVSGKSRGGHYNNCYPTPTSNHNIDRNTFGGATRISEDDTKFAGLCLRCHAKENLTDGTPKNNNWKTVDRIHESVKGWGANTEHSFTCSKCHQPHVSGLPRLMQTNCLDHKHRGKKPSGGQPWGAQYLSALGKGQDSSARTQNGYNYPPHEMRGYPVANIYSNSESYPYETSCHFNAAPVKSGDPTTWPDKNYWNNVTPW